MSEQLFIHTIKGNIMKTLISILASMALALGATFAHADDHAAPSAPVGMVYGLDVSDPAAFAGAMGKYWSSPTGEQNPGVAILRQVVAGGESPISHIVSVVYPSYEAMDAAFAINAQSEDEKPDRIWFRHGKPLRLCFSFRPCKIRLSFPKDDGQD